MSASALHAIGGMRIAHLIESDGPGGAERVVAQLASALAARGCPGVAFLPAHGEGWLGRELEAVGIPIEYIHLEGRNAPGARGDHRRGISNGTALTSPTAMNSRCRYMPAALPHSRAYPI